MVHSIHHRAVTGYRLLAESDLKWGQIRLVSAQYRQQGDWRMAAGKRSVRNLTRSLN